MAKKIYGLSAADKKLVQETIARSVGGFKRRRPTNKRRRFAGGGGGNIKLFFTHASTGFDAGGADITTTGSSLMIVGDDPGPGITVHNKLLLTGTPTNDILVVGNSAGEYWIVAVSDPTWTWLKLQPNFSEGDPQVFGHSSSGDPLWYDVNDCPTCE